MWLLRLERSYFLLISNLNFIEQVMLETLDSVMTFLGLLTIFIFTSSILGMHLFGGKMIIDDEVVRHNFDDLLWSLITVFQVSETNDLFFYLTWIYLLWVIGVRVMLLLMKINNNNNNNNTRCTMWIPPPSFNSLRVPNTTWCWLQASQLN